MQRNLLLAAFQPTFTAYSLLATLISILSVALLSSVSPCFIFLVFASSLILSILLAFDGYGCGEVPRMG